ncbi:MAG TPA: glycosyltransferase [Bacteroidia bacterium]|nr:glycosyltransferase [Bacteroidia bacterium]
MKISVIIVNYNVEHFLEQCLHSVRAALKGIEGEVFVVDNNSVDGSLLMLKQKFPEVKVIANKENLGFSKANNQAMRVAKGEYVLLLNPDTVVEENTFSKVLAFMDAHADAGGLGVYMIDGKGNFLPESKRGLPTPSVAFYKMFGLSKLFPRSKKFGRYHLGYLDKNKTHEVEILSGAFMLMRKAALDKVGLLDEDYFMYGEDIDLSYRLILGGYKNYYFPETKIIHYKGESTKKSSVNYVFVFYRAMVIFAKKHFSVKNAKTFSFLINFAIWLRAGAALFTRFIKAIALPVFDFAVLLSVHYFMTRYYAANFKFGEGGTFQEKLVNILLPVYNAIWILAVYFSGGYDKPVRLMKIVRGVFAGTAANLVMYALLPEDWRFSRLIILVGAGWALVSLLLSRFILSLTPLKSMRIESGHAQRIAIVGSLEECKRVSGLIRQTSANISFAGFVNAKNEESDPMFIGRFGQLTDIVTIYGIDEVIFCAKDLEAKQIIDRMSQLGDSRKVNYKIAPPESLSIIGSNSIDTAGDLYVIDINSISKPVNRRNKRVIDLGVSLIFLSTFPVSIWFAKNPIGFLGNIFAVLFGSKTWVGYSESKTENIHLPKLRQAVLHPSDVLPSGQRTEEIKERLNLLYAKDYKVGNDLNIIRKAFRSLGN